MYRKYVPFLLFLFFLYGCNGNKQEEKEDVSVFVDLPQLKAEGEITAVTLYSSTSYFQYKMQPMGYEYDLINDFAKSQGLKLNIKVRRESCPSDRDARSRRGRCCSLPIPINNKLKQEVIYCGRVGYLQSSIDTTGQ